MILYKYRQPSLFTDQIFTERKVWLAKSSSLNDPCECTLHSLDPEWVAKTVKTMKEAQMMGFLTGIPGSRADCVALEFRDSLRDIKDFEERYQAFRAMYEKRFPARLSSPALLFAKLEDQLKNVGVFSLSETSEHPLMWAHYAEGHEGICLGFEVTDGMAMSDRDRFIRVKYTDVLPQMPKDGFRQKLAFAFNDEGRLAASSSISLTDETLRTAIGTKSATWAYEQEWRYIGPAAGKYEFPGPLVEIVFGLRCNDKQRQHYTDLAAAHLSNDIRLYEMRRIPNSRAFERIPLGVCLSKIDATRGPAVNVQHRDVETSIAETHPTIQRKLDKRQFSQVLPEIDRALEQNPNSFKLWRTKGVAHGMLEQHQEALACFERATELKPEFFSGWYHRGVACTSLGRYEEAIVAYKKAHRLNPLDASTSFNLGTVLAALGQLEEAKESLIAAQKAGHSRALDTLGDIARNLRKTPATEF